MIAGIALAGGAWIFLAFLIVGFLGIAALYQPLTYTGTWLFMTQNRTGEMLRWGMIGSALTTLSVLAGLPFGAVGVAASYAISGLVIRMPLLSVLLWSAAGTLAWTSLLSGLGYALEGQYERIADKVDLATQIVLVLLAATYLWRVLRFPQKHARG